MYNIEQTLDYNDEIPDGYEDFTSEFSRYVSSLFNGTTKKKISIMDLKAYFTRKYGEFYEELDILFFFNSAKIVKASTFEETETNFRIWETRFDKAKFYKYFEEGASFNRLADDFSFFQKQGSDRTYLYSNNGSCLNLYYFFVFKKVYNKKINIDENKKESYNEYNEKRGVMSKFEDTVRDFVEINKEAAQKAAMIKIGDTANKTVVDILRKNVLPKKYQKFSNSPFFTLVAANVASVVMKSAFKNRNQRVEDVADAMVLASMVDIANMVDINSMVKQVMESVDLSSLTGNNELD